MTAFAPLQTGLQITTTCLPLNALNTGASAPTTDKTPIRFLIVPAALCPPSTHSLAAGGRR